MPKDDRVYLGHMLDVARNVMQRVAKRTREDYETDEDLRIIVAHLIQTIGEAAARVYPSLRESHPEILGGRSSAFAAGSFTTIT